MRAGSFFEPVAGERFGLVTCNPPYVISPESAFLFRDSGREGDAVRETSSARCPTTWRRALRIGADQLGRAA